MVRPPEDVPGGPAVAFLVGVQWPLFSFQRHLATNHQPSTTIITFLMVFLIQNTQNRDNDTLHIKIDELLRTTKNAHTALLNLDQLTAKELRTLRKTYAALSEAESEEKINVEALCETLGKTQECATPIQNPSA